VNPIFAAALEVQAFCESKDWRFCIIGALAVQRWGYVAVPMTGMAGFVSASMSEEQPCDALILY